jgi:hypothetical protein
MSKTGWIAGFASATVLKTVLRIISLILKLISTLLLYFGLYIPFFYLVYGVLLHLLAGVPLFDFSMQSQLYMLGLLLTVVSAVIISVRNLIMTPLRDAVAFFDRNNQPEQPMIYRSELLPDLIIHEYHDRYDVFRDVNGRVTFLRTEPKGRR